jgi:hypothetical protein
METLPTPPAIIKIKEDLSQGLDLRNPLHAKAYLKAASHFLSSWNQEWSAEKLCLVMIADEEDEAAMNDRKEISVWSAISNWELHPMDDTDPWYFIEEIINGLAEDFVTFLSENA